MVTTRDSSKATGLAQSRIQMITLLVAYVVMGAFMASVLITTLSVVLLMWIDMNKDEHIRRR